MPQTLTLTLPRFDIPRFVWVAIGVGCLCVLIWFVGPLIALAGQAPLAGWLPRLALILAVVVVTLGVYLLRRSRAEKANQAMVRDLAAPPAEAPPPEDALSAQDVKAMEERAAKAIELMGRGRIGRERELVYELPWYIIIGPPGAGKTTALQNTGLKFPVAQELGAAPVRGVGGTRTCEWWFTDQAVLIDTAGRYTTQDSQQAVDAKSWNGFLDLLKRYRPRQPVTGVIVAISVTDLLEGDESQALAHGRAVRARINEIAQRFGVRTPVYVVLTKLDLLAGFTEYFDDLDAQTRDQVWGHTFALDVSTTSVEATAFAQAFQGLVQRLTDRLLSRTQVERDMQRRGLIFGFPQQFASLEGPLNSLLQVIGRDTKFEPTPLLRGVYFTSGVQFGRPIDRLLASISKRFGVSESPAATAERRGRSFFLHDLLDKVMFPEAAIAGRDPKAERRRRLIRLSVAGAGAAALTLLTLAWIVSYAGNAHLAHLLRERASTLHTDAAVLPQGDVTDSDLGVVLPVLDEARALPFASTASPNLRSAGFSFGLGRAASLRPEVDGAYHNLLNRQMLPRLILMLEDRLRSLTGAADAAQNKDVQSQIYDLLRVYLMLGRSIGAPLERDQIQGWFENAWADRYPGAEDDPLRAQLSAHLQSLLAGPITPPPLDRDLITQARADVAGLSPGERIYTRLIDDPGLRALQPYALVNVPEVGSSGLFVRKSGKSLALGVPGMFRRANFYGPVMSAIGKAAASSSDESWVMGEASLGGSVSEAGRVKDGILIAYLADFTRQWDDYINDIGISGQYPEDERIRRAVRPPSPVKALFSSLASETNLTPPSVAPPRTGFGAAMLRTTSLFSPRIYSGVSRADQFSQIAAAGPPKPKGPLDEVIDHYQWLRDLQPLQGPSPLDDALNALKDTADSTLAAKTAQGMGDSTLQKDRASTAMADTAKLKQSAAGLPAVAGALFTGFANASTQQLNQGARTSIDQQWTQVVLPECRSILAQGYPFQKGERQTSVDDFSRLFRPGGLIDQFVQSNLAGDVDTSSGGWTLTPAGRALGLSMASVLQLERADHIRRAFFKPGDVRPNVRFVLEPVSLPSNASAVTLTLDGVPAAFEGAARKPVELRWPGASPGVVVSYQGAGGTAPSTHSWSGDWALARMLDETRSGAASTSGLTFEPAVESYRASFHIRFQDGVNPFSLTDLRTFACPSGF